MIPTVDERIASIVRALSEVILPHLPPEASLAQEQVQLAIGHLQILRGQIDHIPAYEREELTDAVAIATALLPSITGGSAVVLALDALRASVGGADGHDVRGETRAIHQGIERLVKAVAIDGVSGANAVLTATILAYERERVIKDRKWFLPFGFDTM
ncbi:hypothetical protein [Aquisediminimonas sediminicola]|uniref:hypothetical protein n=1 Tax=Alteraquisediminimonas sediminicola TaxID=2676787 RepID=UPI001C8E2BDD|nr:hypothetical protein [Aquisediminimonas sediminicola]